MKKITILLLMFFIISVFVTVSVFPKDTKNLKTVKVVKKVDKKVVDPIVYVKENGKKYHKRNCKIVSGKKGIKLSEALKKGYEPCKVCFESETVYVTENGKKYHKKGCKAGKDMKAIQLGTAKLKGYEPCKMCFPPEIKKDIKAKKK